MIDTNDKTEYWRYLYERSSAERKFDGLICFIERFYRDVLGSALAAEGSGPGGWWQASKGAHAFAFIGRRAAGSSGSGLIAEATTADVLAATVQ